MIIEGVVFLFFFFGTVCFYFGLISLAYYPLALWYPVWERRLLKRARIQGYTPSVSVLVPAYNEENTIARSLRSILASDYPEFEVIVINDGSVDRSEEELRDLFADPRLYYITKKNGGKSSALNLGIEQARGEIILFTDADSLFEPDTIRNGVSYFVDPTIGAVSGNDTVMEPRGPLQKMLVITSHIGTGFVRRALSLIGVLQIISGNLGLVRADILRQIGGFRQIWGEDLEVTLRLKRHGVRVVYGASTRVLADCPSTIASLWKQRVRWLRSYIKILRIHRDLIGNPKYGWFGLFLAFNVVNMLLIPLLQVLALLLLPLAWWQSNVVLSPLEWIAYLGFGFLIAAATVAVLLDKTPRDILYLPYAVLLVFFSQFYNIVVLHSIWAEMRAHEEAWHKIKRRDISVRTRDRERFPGTHVALMVVAILFGAGCLGATENAQGEERVVPPIMPLVSQAGETVVAIHFDAWLNWRYAYLNLLINPQAKYVNRVAVTAGRADWTYFRWPGHESWWSSEQRSERADILEETLAVLRRNGYRTTAIFDVFGERYLERYPAAAALDIDNKRSKMIICSTELDEGDAGDHLVRAVDALASSTTADTIAITELFYDRHCYDDRCLVSFKKATGQGDWPRNSTGSIDYLNTSIGMWRSHQIANIVKRLSQVVHAHGKKFALDVKVSRGDLTRNSAENGQDYTLLAPYVDEFVVWDYFATEGEPPEVSAKIASYFKNLFGANKFYLSIGLWGHSGSISGETLRRALRSAQEGGASQLWITPAEKMSASHWEALADVVGTTDVGHGPDAEEHP